MRDDRVGEGWVRPSRCETNGCFEVKIYDDMSVSLRLTGDEGPVLNATPTEWQEFRNAILAGEFSNDKRFD